VVRLGITRMRILHMLCGVSRRYARYFPGFARESRPSTIRRVKAKEHVALAARPGATFAVRAREHPARHGNRLWRTHAVISSGRPGQNHHPGSGGQEGAANKKKQCVGPVTIKR